MVSQSDNAGASGPYHTQGNAFAKSHLGQSVDRQRFALDERNSSGFVGAECVERDLLQWNVGARHGKRLGRDTGQK